MKLLAFDPAGEGGDVGWATVDTETKKVRYGSTPLRSFRITPPRLAAYDIVISEDYNIMFNIGDAVEIKNFNNKLEGMTYGRCDFKLVQPQQRTNVPDGVVNKIIKEDKSHHKDATSALRHALNFAAKEDFDFNLYLCNGL